MSWWPSFNFSLPSLSPPLSIQRRFISFVLKRSLGHLLKPGQLDVQQIDAQIGNGFVEVKDLELDSNAISTLLKDIPIRLVEGSIGSVTVQIPWPNPFTATIGLSISNLDLTFALSESGPLYDAESLSHDLAASVASVADSFIHDELSNGEEAMLRQSVHQNFTGRGGPPGSLDPFFDADNGPEALPTAGATSDPEGISIFAGLFEGLLARFEFTAVDICVRLVHESNARFDLHTARVQYFTVQDGGAGNANSLGERRSLEISGLKLTMQDLSSPREESHAATQLRPSVSSSDNSDSELDEETQMMMSQSLVSLPPRMGTSRHPPPLSPSLSTISSASGESSMYQSAISDSGPASRPRSPLTDLKTENVEGKGEVLLSIPESISITLITPPPYAPNADPSNSNRPIHDADSDRSDSLRLEISLDLVLLTLRARHLKGILKAVESIPKSPPVTSNAIPTDSSTFLSRLEFAASVKGLVALTFDSVDDEFIDSKSLETFFAHPLVPPKLNAGYLRLHVDTVQLRSFNTASFSLGSQGCDLQASCTVSDFSLLAFHAPGSPSDQIHASSPVLVTDLHLPQSYLHVERRPSEHVHPRTADDKSRSLPSFEVVDWTSEKGRTHGASLRPWRTKRPASTAKSRLPAQGVNAGFTSGVGLSTSPGSPRTVGFGGPASPPRSSSQHPERTNQPALAIDLLRGSGDCPSSINVETASLHLFLELHLLSSALAFADAAGLGQAKDESTRTRHASLEQRKGGFMSDIARQELEDLSLSLDYSEVEALTFSRDNAMVDSPFQSLARISDLPQKRAQAHQNNTFNVAFHVPLIRLEVRAPPAANHAGRTGSFVIDLHEVHFLSDGLPSPPKSTGRRVGFERAEEEDWYTDWIGRETKSLRLERVVCAYAAYSDSKAKAFISLGPEDANAETNVLAYPMVLVSSSSLSSSRSTIRNAQAPASPATVLLRIPSVHIDLSKEILDNLQLWADDVTQWSAKLDSSQGSQPISTTNSAGTSRNPSLIGSRYFAKRSESGATESDISNQAAGEQGEVVLKVAVVEGFIRLNMPTVKDVGEACRMLDVSVSDVDTLVEVKPQGKDETVVTLGIAGVHVEESVSNACNTLIQTRLSDTRTALNLRFHAINIPQTTAKESKIRLALHGLIIDLYPDFDLLKDVATFVKAPPGAFETVVPSERTRLSVTVSESSIRATTLSRTSALTMSLSDVGFSTDLVGNSSSLAFNVFGGGMSVLLTDSCASLPKKEELQQRIFSDAEYWTTLGYALIANVEDFKIDVTIDNSIDPVDVRVNVDGLNLAIHLCADTISGIAGFATDMTSAFSPPTDESAAARHESFQAERHPVPMVPSSSTSASTNLLRSLDEEAFKKIPEIGPIPDMIGDDLPSNLEYLDSSFGAAAGLRPLDDDDLDEFSPEEIVPEGYVPRAGLSRFGGETIKMLQPSLNIVENFYDTLPPGALVSTPGYGETLTRIRLRDVNCRLLLHDGYDWEKTRTAIQEEVKRVKRRLAKIRQLLASGQTYDPTVDEVNTMLFNSVYVGLDQEAEELEPGALIAKIDEELLDDQTDLRSESSWQSFKPDMPSSSPRPQGFIAQSKKLTRARGPSVEFSLKGFDAEFDQYRSKVPLVSRLLFTVRDVEILDHMKTSTWSTFLTQLRSDSRGNIREADSDMVRVGLQMIMPNAGHSNQEARLKAKLLPLRLHVDQDALDFLKKFFSFSDSSPSAASPPPKDEIYFQHAEVFPVDITLDYKPRRVDYRALKEGKTIELMNFFHFDGAEMTLRHITLKGITGWPRFFDSLNDLWTPDVKANQLVDVISGVSPIRSAVNVGSGIADLVLLPIAQYKKDGRVIRGLQKGTKAFVKSTAMEAIKLGAQLATGTQVVLEQAENFLGVKGEVTTETLQFPSGMPMSAEVMSDNDDSDSDLISRYAEQPKNIKEGVQFASKAFAKNLKVAGQTILAVPMEVYERSGSEGPARAVIRAVPIAVLKPMIGASEAVSKTLLGLRNTLDPSIPIDSEVKYKHR